MKILTSEMLLAAIVSMHGLRACKNGELDMGSKTFIEYLTKYPTTCKSLYKLHLT